MAFHVPGVPERPLDVKSRVFRRQDRGGTLGPRHGAPSLSADFTTLATLLGRLSNEPTNDSLHRPDFVCVCESQGSASVKVKQPDLRFAQTRRRDGRETRALEEREKGRPGRRYPLTATAPFFFPHVPQTNLAPVLGSCLRLVHPQSYGQGRVERKNADSGSRFENAASFSSSGPTVYFETVCMKRKKRERDARRKDLWNLEPVSRTAVPFRDSPRGRFRCAVMTYAFCEHNTENVLSVCAERF